MLIEQMKLIIDIVNICIILLLLLFIWSYLLNAKTPIPKKIIDEFMEPSVRFISYILVYLLSYWNKLIGIVYTITILLINLDINNYIKRS